MDHNKVLQRQNIFYYHLRSHQKVMRTVTIYTMLMLAVAEAKTIITAESCEHNDINRRPSYDDYIEERNKFIKQEEECFLGAELNLSEEEQIVNKHIMKLKENELNEGFENCYNFIPSRHYFEMLDRIKESKLFQFIQKLPKGGVLHAHDTAIGATNLIVNATYREHLWQKGEFEDQAGPKFRFSVNSPGDGYEKVAVIRERMTEDVYNSKVIDLFGLYDPDPINAYKSIDKVWAKFQKMFFSLEPLITYEPVWRQYYYDSLQQFYDDNVHYLEFRGVLPKVYDLDGTIHTPDEIVQIYIDETERFKKNHPKFIGVKFIYAPIRFGNATLFEQYFKTAKELHQKFPNFVIGFDLVGQEDTGKPLIDFVPDLLKLPETIHFFFHAGETNWYGMKSDRNLVDAILLGTKRIGHGFALVKHPHLLQELKTRKVCVEINPISNQVLKLVQDYRNHPAALFFSDDYPVVVSSDDPSFWRATPLSHDFYMAFLGIASAHHDLRLLKKLALNSIRYSALNETEKRDAYKTWDHTWTKSMAALVMEIQNESD